MVIYIHIRWILPTKEFFLLFLLATDSHSLNSLVIRGLAARIDQLNTVHNRSHHQATSPDPSQGRSSASQRQQWQQQQQQRAHQLALVRRSFCDRVLTLRLLGRFLGVLIFAPNWSFQPPAQKEQQQHKQQPQKATAPKASVVEAPSMAPSMGVAFSTAATGSLAFECGPSRECPSI